MPTAINLNTLSYAGYCALRDGLGLVAHSAILNSYLRCILAVGL